MCTNHCANLRTDQERRKATAALEAKAKAKAEAAAEQQGVCVLNTYLSVCVYVYECV